MKKINSLLMIIMIAVTTGAMAQVSATASSSATIVAPIGITNTADLNFGNVATNGTAGTVILAPNGGLTISGQGASLPTIGAGENSAAAFEVTGQGVYTYSIVLPSEVVLTDGESNTMTVDNFVSNSLNIGIGVLILGEQTINVGATLNVGANQQAGTYTNSTDLTVTVNYN